MQSIKYSKQMKRNYFQQDQEEANMFSKLHHQQHYQLHHHHQLSLDRQISEEVEDESIPNIGIISKKAKPDSEANNSGGGGAATGAGAGDGATIEVAKRPRGRPPGSKNKPRPPMIITRDTECAMRPLLLELPNGIDIIDAVARFTHRRNIGLTILTASGTVTNVSFRQPSTTTIVTFHGRFDILSISATFLPPSLSKPSLSLPSSFTITLAGSQGQIVGGAVAGSLITAGTVFIVAASFSNPSYIQLPIKDEEEESINATSSMGGEEIQPPSLVDSCGMSLYNSHQQLPNDSLWTSTATPQPPPPPPF